MVILIRIEVLPVALTLICTLGVVVLVLVLVLLPLEVPGAGTISSWLVVVLPVTSGVLSLAVLVTISFVVVLSWRFAIVMLSCA